MDARDFQALAVDLAEFGWRSSHFRTAIGRAYYAAFNIGAEFLRAQQLNVPRSGWGHKYVSRALGSSGNLSVRRAGQQLNDLRTQRNRADYDMRREDVEKRATARLNVAQAARIIAVLDSLPALSSAAQIVQAMRQWDRTKPRDPEKW